MYGGFRPLKPGGVAVGRVRRLLVGATFCFAWAQSASGQETQFCAMSPSHLAIPMPDRGLEWIDGEDRTDVPCGANSENVWMRAAADSFDVVVSADGPNGSGRYWTIIVGVAAAGQRQPNRGACLSTSTAGWRTLQQFSGALPWLGDRDGDGRPELFLWDSFPLLENEELRRTGLVAWVYEIRPDQTYTIDWELTRELSREVANAYRSPLDSDDPALEALREDAARQLDALASNTCRIRGSVGRE